MRGGNYLVQFPCFECVNGTLRHIEVLRLLIEKSPSGPRFANHLQYPINPGNQFARADNLLGGYLSPLSSQAPANEPPALETCQGFTNR
jgi:hypothetical protein